MRTRELIFFIVVAIVVVVFGVIRPRSNCPIDYVWVLSDAKWVCVQAEGAH